jgi:nucleoside-diphosphate-sugar epimerase
MKCSSLPIENIEVNPKSRDFRPPIATPHHAYCGAKAYCTAYINEVKSNYPFSIVQIMPGTVIGPSELAASVAEAYAQMDRMSKAFLFDEMRPRYAFGFVSVEDCAAIHIEALDQRKVPDGNIPGWFVAAAPTPKEQTAQQLWKEVGEMIEKEFSEQVKDGLFKIGWDKIPVNIPYTVDSTLTEEILLGGKKFKSLIDCVRDVAHWYARLAEKDKSI